MSRCLGDGGVVGTRCLGNRMDLHACLSCKLVFLCVAKLNFLSDELVQWVRFHHLGGFMQIYRRDEEENISAFA